jgi:hypothetical protein
MESVAAMAHVGGVGAVSLAPRRHGQHGGLGLTWRLFLYGEWIEWFLFKVCVEERKFETLFRALCSADVECSDSGEYNAKHAFVLGTLSKYLTNHPKEVTVSDSFALQVFILIILFEKKQLEFTHCYGIASWGDLISVHHILQAYSVGRALTKKLKELIPRQMFFHFSVTFMCIAR